MAETPDQHDQRRRDLAAALAGLRTRDPGASETLGRVAHDLRGPLNAIAMNVELLRVLPPDHPSRAQKLAAIQGSVDSMSRLLDAIAGAGEAPAR